MATSIKPAKQLVRVTSKKDLPDDAVLLSKSEAIELQWRLVLTWKPRTDAWPFSVGTSLLASVAGLGGFVVNNHYRRKLNLLLYAPLTTFLPLVVVPMALTASMQAWLVGSEILIGNYTCPLCMETRAALLQLGLGMGYPLVLAPFATFYLAAASYRYAVPSITDYKGVYSLYKKVNKRLGTKLMYLCALQVIGATAITKLQMNSIGKISDKILANDDKLKELGGDND